MFRRLPLASSRALLAAALLGGAAAAPAQVGQVVRIHDGDTVTLQAGRARLVVRLQDIDAPELSQPFGMESRGTLRALCPVGSAAEANGSTRDRYGRLIATLSCAGQDASSHQVREGMAWVFRRYASATSHLFQIEIEARAAGRGLWVDVAPTPPWEHRARQK